MSIEKLRPKAKTALRISASQDRQVIIVDDGLINQLQHLLKNYPYDKMILIYDHQLSVIYPNLVDRILQSIQPSAILPINTTNDIKSFENVQQIIQTLIDTRASRKSCLVALGGGSLGDLTGFTASLFMRGIDFIQIPTTLMSMADAIIGKVAIDHKNVKNLLGSFSSPRVTICDTDFTSTLPKPAIAEGLVEIWKHALIVHSTTQLRIIDELLDNNIEGGDLSSLISFSLRTKNSHVEPDPHETKQIHTALSLGHTLANYLEKKYHLEHGSAVLCGVVHAAILSHQRNLINHEYFANIIQTAIRFDQWLNVLMPIAKQLNPNELLHSLRFDKINHHGKINLVLPTLQGFTVALLKEEEVITASQQFKQQFHGKPHRNPQEIHAACSQAS